jgi:ATPase subunit of ABC transporter with duplicated ATPase domains
MQKAFALKKIEYSIRGEPILRGVSFRCTEDERLCIFGENGAGKSTLLKILAGSLEADSGLIDTQGHIRFKYVPQEFPIEYVEGTVSQYLEAEAGATLVGKAYVIGKELGLDLKAFGEKTCGSLSGGQQKILALAAAFATQPDFLLLDEPENHLDIVSRLALVELLADFRGGIIFISHDRLIIDATATKIGEMVAGVMHISEGDYEDYVEAKTQRISGLQRAFDKETKRMRQLAASIVILRQKAIRGKETSAYHRALEEFNALKGTQKEGRPDDAKTRINLANAEKGLHNGKLLCRIKDGGFRYEGASHDAFHKASLELRSGDRIVLVGRNGAGKSTFLKCLTGALPLTEGSITWGNGVRYSYFDQHAEFDPEATAIEIVEVALRVTDEGAQAALGAMQFDTARMSTAVKNLSGGERMRIRFAIAFGAKPDLLILDEPTNHIDEVTWEILLNACKKSKSSILLVTHDYEFIKEFEPSLFWMIAGRTVLPRYKELDVLLEEMKG